MSPEFAKKINDVEYAKLAPFRAALAEEKMLQNLKMLDSLIVPVVPKPLTFIHQSVVPENFVSDVPVEVTSHEVV